MTSVSATVIYKWVDESEVTHYSQLIPENANDQSTSTKLNSEDIEPKAIGTVTPTARRVKPSPTRCSSY
nr:DUF4124 domain-containing protein [Shewanella benthica]